MRRRHVFKKDLQADPKFNSKIVGKFINMVMDDGKKALAELIVYSAFEKVKTALNEPDALKIFHKAIDNVRPRLEVKPRRVGGATYQVPIEVKQERGSSIALRWIRDYARNRKGKSMVDKLADEIMSAYKGEGAAIKKRDDTHKMADSNKAYAHFRW
ncbi:MAG: 30S ribosomal protein S7 [Candidatus Omnitrophica bacterium]|jgi:small subunit ribosomal protein S7|nr:30S ribosomal protein S7 [Candidatus Omnitrophota bacterium]MDD5079092.1 30S ribosomal protein S7 [Candidatus Omnitrophota bacterium]